jgi:hypothetical protein
MRPNPLSGLAIPAPPPADKRFRLYGQAGTTWMLTVSRGYTGFRAGDDLLPREPEVGLEPTTCPLGVAFCCFVDLQLRA